MIQGKFSTLFESEDKEWLDMFKGKKFNLNSNLPKEFEAHKVISKGYSEVSKILGWTFGGIKTNFIFGEIEISNGKLFITFRATFSGVDKDRFQLPSANIEGKVEVLFNKNSDASGIGPMIRGSVDGNRGKEDVTGLTLSKAKTVLSKLSKRTY